MIFESITGLFWSAADRSSIDGLANIAGDLMPYTFIQSDDPVLWGRLLSGELGTIADYLPPKLNALQDVTMRQAKIALSRAGKLAAADAAIAALSGQPGEEARIEWQTATTLRRDHPLVEALGAGLGLDAAEIDALFLTASVI